MVETERTLSRLAIDGYDPMTYWHDGQARKGSAQITHEWVVS